MRDSTKIEEENTVLKYTAQLIYSPPYGFHEDSQFRNRRYTKKEVQTFYDVNFSTLLFQNFLCK